MPPADSTEDEITYTKEQLAEHERRERVAEQRAKKTAKKESVAATDPDKKPKSAKEH